MTDEILTEVQEELPESEIVSESGESSSAPLEGELAPEEGSELESSTESDVSNTGEASEYVQDLDYDRIFLGVGQVLDSGIAQIYDRPFLTTPLESYTVSEGFLLLICSFLVFLGVFKLINH